MKKIWAYIAMFFVGLSAGLMIAIKTAGDTYSSSIKKIKQRGKKGASQVVEFEPTLNVNGETSSKLRQRRALRREKRKIRKDESTNSL